jgi:predicted ATP-grasp superfamily ATP-dependent carboligase
MTEFTQPPAIVIGTGAVSLGVINDLAAEKVPVIHISSKRDDVALRSRWPVEKIVLGESSERELELLDILDSRRHQWTGGCLFPTTDPAVRVVSKELDSLSSSYVSPTIGWHILKTIVDKAELYSAAEKAGIAVPQILQPHAISEAASWSKEVGYPVIVKPTETPEFFREFGIKAYEADSRDDLLRFLEKVESKRLKVMISEIIPGPTTNLRAYRSYVNTQGQRVAEMCSEKVRSHPPNYGVGIVQRTIPADDELLTCGRNLISAVNFTGFSTAEFKFDERTNSLKLMEINPRPAMVQRMFRAAGINFAYISYRDCLGMTLDQSYNYEPDVYCIYNTVDLYYLRKYAKKGLSGLREFISPYLKRRKALLVPPFRDPQPFFYEIKCMIKRKAARTGQKKNSETNINANAVDKIGP